MCVCMDVCVCAHVCACVCACVWACECACAYVRMCVCMDVFECTCAFTQAYTHAHIQRRTYTCTDAHTQTRTPHHAHMGFMTAWPWTCSPIVASAQGGPTRAAGRVGLTVRVRVRRDRYIYARVLLVRPGIAVRWPAPNRIFR